MSEIVRQPVKYQVNGKDFEGCLLYRRDSRPDRGLLMAPNFFGINDNAINIASRQVNDRQVVFVFDPFGVDVKPSNPDQAMQAMGDLRGDNDELRARVNAGLETLRSEAGKLGVSGDRLAAYGFCFGGACVLELARSGADVRATISFHGLLNTPDPQTTKAISGPVLVLNGADDPMVSPQAKADFKQEMDATGADWQLTDFGGAVHSFTDEGANMPGQSMYAPKVARRAFAAMEDLLEEVFG